MNDLVPANDNQPDTPVITALRLLALSNPEIEVTELRRVNEIISRYRHDPSACGSMFKILSQ